MTKAEEFARVTAAAKNPPKIARGSVIAEVSPYGNLLVLQWPHIYAKDVPMFIDWLHETFVRQIPSHKDLL